MKERVTYIIRKPKQGFDPSGLEITNSSLAVSSLDAAKEHQVTLGLEELPQELRALLRSCHELHVRWSTSRPFESLAPYVSRVTPGLHVFFSPLRNKTANRLCPLLKKVFSPSLKCNSTEESFTTPPILSGRFSHSASRQFFSYVPTITDLVTYVQLAVCSEYNFNCKLRAHDLHTADYLDADYDSISHALILRAYWSKSSFSDELWWETHLLPENGSLEVGVLINEKPDEAEELRYSGFLTQVGKAEKSSPTLFSFPSRHHPLPIANSKYSTSFNKPTGLHPTLAITIPVKSLTPPAPNCYLHTYLTLPSHLFIDRYPLSDSLFLATHHLKSLHTLSGATDLEAPNWVVPQWGSSALFELAPPSGGASKDEQFTATIPLHLRYLPPSNDTDGQRVVPVPWPTLFWACTAESGSQFSNSPFDRVNLGYEGLFGPKTMFYHFEPKPSMNGTGRAVELLKVPVLDLNKARYVEMGTVGVIVLGALWIGWALFSGLKKGAVEKEKEKEKKNA